MKVISNTGPIIALAKIDRLSLIKRLFEKVFIPPMVYKELCAKTGDEWESIEEALDDFIVVKELPLVDESVRLTLADLDEGEKQAVGLASVINDEKILLMDDRAGRKAAQKLNITVTGIVGILLAAKKRGLIHKVSEILEAVRENGYWLSNKVIEVAAKLSGE
ncbi:MAG: DUF3368 domain-containing protein [Nitrospirae bacterium]|nr:DUF3368 domain-containing protein [Nitrospirota bacterium]MBF0535744.1 DUF3368 domain-containing protein [Nitrospirota bacterium]MBF0615773.1 DUF3368 domain-containing protein [Nitrospirota bacterium]